MNNILEYIPYTILLVLILFILESKRLNKKHKTIFIFLLVSLFSGLRYNVGKDYMSYYIAVMNPHLTADRFEFIFRRLCYMTAGMPWLFMLITAFFTNYLIFKNILKHSVKYKLSIMAYICLPFFFLDFMCVVRFATAVALMMFAFLKFNNDRKYFHFLLIWLVAINCHITAIISLLFLVPFNKIPNKYHLIMLISSFFMGQTVMQYMGASAFVERIDLYYARYLINENAVEGQKMLILYMMLSALNFYALIKWKDAGERIRRMLAVINIGFCLLFVFSYNIGFAGRVSRYFLVLMIIAFPYYSIPVLLNNKQSAKVFLVALISVFYLELFIAQYSFYSTKSKSYMPYQTILLKD